MNNQANTALVGLGAAGLFSVFSIIMCLIYFVAFALGLAMFVLWIAMLIDVLQRQEGDFGENFGKDAKLIWLVLILLTGIGAILYYFMVYKKYPRK
jgi:hypothetical protein